MLDIWGQLLIYFYCSLLKKQKQNKTKQKPHHFHDRFPLWKSLLVWCKQAVCSVLHPPWSVALEYGVGGRGGLRATGSFPRRAEWLIGLQLLQLELVLPVFDTTAAMPRSPSFARSVRLRKRFCRFGENEKSLGKTVPLWSMSFSCYEYVKAKCMWIYYICTIKVFD